MIWSHKFAKVEEGQILQALEYSEPWLLLDESDMMEADKSSEDVQGDFIRLQNEEMQRRGWDWFKSTVRGRHYPLLNFTTFTTFDGEQNPTLGDPVDAIPAVREKFPGVALISLIGDPHLIPGTGDIDPRILGILKVRKASKRWKFTKLAQISD